MKLFSKPNQLSSNGIRYFGQKVIKNTLVKSTPLAKRNFCSTSASVKTNNRGSERVPYNYSVNDTIGNFVITSIKEYPDFRIKLYQLEHKILKTKVLHFDTDDTNNCFGINFTTLISDDKGKPHIQEHLLTCGTESFPVKDPFMAMTKRSLNTFMNALTGCDMTAYPYSTTNQQDYKNLMHLYCDICFKPTLNYHDFLQEGWRYEFDEEKNLQYKGVVFNEMKGVLENPSRPYAEALKQEILKGTSYQHNSGGDPESIVNLSHEELQAYYKKYYHPSNCTIYSYGDLNFAETQEFVDQNYLKNYEYLKIDKTEDFGKITLTDEVRKSITLPPNPHMVDPKKQTSLSIGFYLKEIQEDPEDSLGLQILSFLLFESPKSPFYQKFQEAGLASNYAPDTGFTNDYKYNTFSIGFDNFAEENCEEVEKEIYRTLEEIVKNGIDEKLIESAIHQIEIKAKITGANFGFGMYMGLIHTINHNVPGQMDQALEITKSIEELKSKIEKGGYFENLIKKCFLDNKKRVILTANPDHEYTEKKNKLEAEKLLKAQKSLTEEQTKKIISDAALLKNEQEKVSDYSCLPTLKVSDIEPRQIKVECEEIMIEGIKLTYFTQCHEGTTFVRLKFKTKYLDSSLTNFLYIYESFLTQAGTENHKYDEFAELVFCNTGNFSVNVQTQSNPTDKDESESCFIITMACLDKNLEKMFDLLADITLKPDFKDYEHMKNLLRIDSNSLASNFNSFGYAINYSQSKISKAQATYPSFRNARFFIKFAKQMEKNRIFKTHMCEALNESLNFILRKVIRKDCFEIAVHSNIKNKEVIVNRTDNFWLRMSRFYPSFNDSSNMVDDYEGMQFYPDYCKTFAQIPSQVNYSAMSFRIPTYLHEDTAKLSILSQVLSNGHLHKIIREKGGAYGAYSSVSAQNGLFTMASYRDPTNIETFDKFEMAIEKLHSGDLQDEEIDEAKLSLFGSYDKPVALHRKGMSDWITKIDFEDWQKYRLQLLNVKREDLIEVAEKYILKDLKEGNASRATFGHYQKDLKELEEKGWKVHNLVEELKQK